MVEINQFVQDKIQNLADKLNITYEELKLQFDTQYDSEFLATSELPDTMRQSAAFNIISNINVAQSNAVGISFVVVGVSNIKFNRPTRDLFVVTKGKKKVSRIVFSGLDNVNKALEFKLGYMYKDVKVKQFYNGSDYSFLKGVEIPEGQEVGVMKALKLVNIPHVTFDKVTQLPSLVSAGSTFTDVTDWRIITGVIQSVISGNVKKKDRGPQDDRRWTRVNIISADTFQDIVIGTDGKVSMQEYTCWMDESLLKLLTNSSICNFYASVEIQKGVPVLTVYYVDTLVRAPSSNHIIVQSSDDELVIGDEEEEDLS